MSIQAKESPAFLGTLSDKKLKSVIERGEDGGTRAGRPVYTPRGFACGRCWVLCTVGHPFPI